MKKLAVGVLFGGKSGEHEVSLISGTNVIDNLNKEKYEVYAIGIKKDGSFANPSESTSMLAKNVEGVTGAQGIIRSVFKGCLSEIFAQTEAGEFVTLDIIFPVLHGTLGEDGTLQGLLEMCEIPYVGCGVAASSIAMDKILTKELMKSAGLNVVSYIPVHTIEWETDKMSVKNNVINSLSFPCFVKPSRLGSSVGISKINCEKELERAIDTAFLYDYKILIEKGIDAREIECSVMGNHSVIASIPGEIISGSDFYDYNAKYVDNSSKLLLPAPLETPLIEEIRQSAIQAFKALGAHGYARVDFLLDKKNHNIYVNEINTIPGFTEISMFPKLWDLTGLKIDALLDKLIELAIERSRWEKSILRVLGSNS